MLSFFTKIAASSLLVIAELDWHFFKLVYDELKT